jgi:Ca2+-binding RTX toxin-like protein
VDLLGGVGSETLVGTPHAHVFESDGGGGSDALDDAAFTTKVIVHKLVGRATGSYGISAIENVIGGSGDDHLVGYAADNILLGNDGDDELDDRSPTPSDGSVERNVLIGGRGSDLIRGSGGAEEELLIGGSTIHDASFAAPRAIRAGWTSSTPMAARVAHLRGETGGGLNGGVLLEFGVPGAAVVDDLIADFMHGGALADWFFASRHDDADRTSDDFLN